MTDRINGGSPVVYPQQYRTLPATVIDGAQQRDRYPNHSEAKELSAFFSTGLKRLEIAQTLASHSEKIVAAGGKRIFVGGNPMDYFERPDDLLGLPGSGYYIAEDYLSTAERERQSQGMKIDRAAEKSSRSPITWFKALFFSGKPSVPSSFRAISISKYGAVRMKRSMRDLGWFLRYITYAIVAGDTSIIRVNTRGLRGVIPEDVTLATAVALREMQWKSLSYFSAESAAAALVKQYFDVLIADYWVEKPSDRLRFGVSKHHQGLSLPESYEDSSSLKPRWVMKPSLSELEKMAVIKAAYRQVFERDIGQLYGHELGELISRVKGAHGSMQSFIRRLGKSRLYRQLYYEPYTISRSIELACRHFLGRGLSCMEEFQGYFELVSDQGFPALVDALIDSQEYAEYFGEETVPFLRGLGQEAQACRNWGPQLDLLKYSAPMRKVPQFVTTFAGYQQPLPNQHPYGMGNDPLETQFGAIFPHENRHPRAQPAHFSEDSRRILISSGEKKGHPSAIKHDVNTHAELGRVPGASEQRIFALPSPPMTNGRGSNSSANGSRNGGHSTTFLGLNSTQHSVDAIILATYRQIFGRAVLESQRQSAIETQLRGDLITVRELVRQLAKSRVFRRLAWETLYITKSIEYIHRRLLGRPTRDRRELNKYYDICSRQGFYALVDAIVDSDEYTQVFGDNTVPYERYVTPRGLALRIPQGPVAKSQPRENPPIVEAYMMRYQLDVHRQSLTNGSAQKALSSFNKAPNQGANKALAASISAQSEPIVLNSQFSSVEMAGSEEPVTQELSEESTTAQLETSSSQS